LFHTKVNIEEEDEVFNSISVVNRKYKQRKWLYLIKITEYNNTLGLQALGARGVSGGGGNKNNPLDDWLDGNKEVSGETIDCP